MKRTLIPLLITAAFIGGVIFLTSGGTPPSADSVPVNNVTVVNGQQIVEIHAKGGFQPRMSIAKAGLPTVIRFNTNGTFDCSSSVRIPSLNISKLLPQSGSTDIDIGNATLGTLQGTCGMGMYPFSINFQG